VSRTEAQRLITEGDVLVGGIPATRSATMVTETDAVTVVGERSPFVSRGGLKLDGALEDLDVIVEGRSWLDAGASTGGFTDRLLQGGASRVIAADVGYGQLDWRLRNDPRVVVLERTNVRNLVAGDLPFQPDGVVADLSFISLVTVLPSLAAVAVPGADLVLLVKPQFEVGKDKVGKGGVVRDPILWREALDSVVEAAAAAGLGLAGATPSMHPGPAGNREFFVHLRAGAAGGAGLLDRAVEDAPR
jgi:23S rRNA (cytidine1920-2'-O)/16S rRNA (cytidine1409-2'-O)-methyltransferase